MWGGGGRDESHGGSRQQGMGEVQAGQKQLDPCPEESIIWFIATVELSHWFSAIYTILVVRN